MHGLAEIAPDEDVPPLVGIPLDMDHGHEPQNEYGAGYLSANQAGTRFIGLIVTGALHALFAAAFLVHWGVTYIIEEQPRITVFDVAPPAAPPVPETEIPPGPDQVEQEEPLPEIDRPKIELPAIQLVSENSIALPEVVPVPRPTPPVEKTTAPESRPAPPALRVSDAVPSWQGKVLAALNKAKRYPRSALRRGQQGTPWIRFVMNREGHVLSVTLEQSSGVPALDKEALKLPKRADPLPAPPVDLPGQSIELVVPVEFFKR